VRAGFSYNGFIALTPAVVPPMTPIRLLTACALTTLLALPAVAALPDFSGMQDNTDSPFLDTDAAFQLQAVAATPQELTLTWHIADGYYLYRDRIHLQVNGREVAARFSREPDLKDDPSFGRVAVFMMK